MATDISMQQTESFGETTPLPPQAATHNQLEQFVILSKKVKGKACLELIKQVLESPGVHVFGELLSMPNIKEVNFVVIVCNFY